MYALRLQHFIQNHSYYLKWRPLGYCELKNIEIVLMCSKCLKAVHKHIPPGFETFPEVKVVLFLAFLVNIHFFGLFYLLGSINGVLVKNINDCPINVLSDYTLPSILYGITWILAPIPGFIADRYWGRQKMISVCFAISFVGTIILLTLEVARLNFTQGYCSIVVPIYFISYTLQALGSSGLIVLMIPYGVDQLEGANEVTLSKYFYWYVWCVFTGKLTIYGQYIYYSEGSSFINREGLLTLGNGFIAIIALFFAIYLFKISQIFNLLATVNPILNPLKLMIKVIKNALVTRRHSDPAIKMYSNRNWLDYATIELGGRFSYEHVNSVKSLLNMLPIMFSLIWIYCLTNEFPYDLFLAQGAQMDPRNSKATAQIICYSVVGLTVVVTIPILEIQWISSKLRKIFPTILSRLFFGASVLVVAYVSACIIELVRLINCESNGLRIIPIEVQIPQYILVGIGTVFILANAFEFVYAQSPAMMKGVAFGVLSFMYGLGSLLPIALYEILIQFGADRNDDKFYCNQTLIAVFRNDKLDECKDKCTLSYVTFGLILFISLVNLIIFGVLIWRYKPWNRNRPESDLRFFVPRGRVIPDAV